MWECFCCGLSSRFKSWTEENLCLFPMSKCRDESAFFLFPLVTYRSCERIRECWLSWFWLRCLVTMLWQIALKVGRELEYWRETIGGTKQREKTYWSLFSHLHQLSNLVFLSLRRLFGCCCCHTTSRLLLADDDSSLFSVVLRCPSDPLKFLGYILPISISLFPFSPSSRHMRERILSLRMPLFSSWLVVCSFASFLLSDWETSKIIRRRRKGKERRESQIAQFDGGGMTDDGEVCWMAVELCEL